jgi:hypothetical protein
MGHDLRTHGGSIRLTRNGPVGEEGSEFGLQGSETADLIFGAINMPLQQLLNGAARGLAAIEDPEDISDFFQREPEVFCPCDEADALRGAAIIEPVAARGSPRGRQQPDRFVIAQGTGFDAQSRRHCPDEFAHRVPQAGAYTFQYRRRSRGNRTAGRPRAEPVPGRSSTAEGGERLGSTRLVHDAAGGITGKRAPPDPAERVLHLAEI